MKASHLTLVMSASLALCACSGTVDNPGAADAAVLDDAGIAETQTADTAQDGAVVRSCAELSNPGYIDVACDFEGSCGLGQECCCGQCFTSMLCSCSGGTLSCYNTDACYHATCKDAAPPPDGPTPLDCASLQAHWPQVDLASSCDFAGSCELGQECCCGQCYASMVCSCSNGSLGCYATDACMIPGCPDAAGVCVAPLADCDGDPANGCETDLATDAANCGTCGNVCGAGESCVSGVCS